MLIKYIKKFFKTALLSSCLVAVFPLQAMEGIKWEGFSDTAHKKLTIKVNAPSYTTEGDLTEATWLELKFSTPESGYFDQLPNDLLTSLTPALSKIRVLVLRDPCLHQVSDVIKQMTGLTHFINCSHTIGAKTTQAAGSVGVTHLAICSHQGDRNEPMMPQEHLGSLQALTHLHLRADKLESVAFLGNNLSQLSALQHLLVDVPGITQAAVQWTAHTGLQHLHLRDATRPETAKQFLSAQTAEQKSVYAAILNKFRGLQQLTMSTRTYPQGVNVYLEREPGKKPVLCLREMDSGYDETNYFWVTSALLSFPRYVLRLRDHQNLEVLKESLKATSQLADRIMFWIDPSAPSWNLANAALLPSTVIPPATGASVKKEIHGARVVITGQHVALENLTEGLRALDQGEETVVKQKLSGCCGMLARDQDKEQILSINFKNFLLKQPKYAFLNCLQANALRFANQILDTEDFQSLRSMHNLTALELSTYSSSAGPLKYVQLQSEARTSFTALPLTRLYLGANKGEFFAVLRGNVLSQLSKLEVLSLDAAGVVEEVTTNEWGHPRLEQLRLMDFQASCEPRGVFPVLKTEEKFPALSVLQVNAQAVKGVQGPASDLQPASQSIKTHSALLKKPNNGVYIKICEEIAKPGNKALFPKTVIGNATALSLIFVRDFEEYLFSPEEKNNTHTEEDKMARAEQLASMILNAGLDDASDDACYVTDRPRQGITGEGFWQKVHSLAQQ